MNSLLKVSRANLFLALALVFTFILAAPASAAIQITSEKVLLDVDYNQFTSESQKQIAANGKISLSNSGTENANLILSFNNLPSDYQTEDVTGITLAAGENKTISFTVQVPHKKDSGLSSIGTVMVKDAATKAVLTDKPLIQNTKSMLFISEIKIEYTDKNGKPQKEELSSEKNDILKLDGRIKPGTEVKMTFFIENAFDRDYDQDYAELDNIELNIDPDDKDLFADQKFEEIHSFENVQAHKKDQKTITFLVSDDVDQGEFQFDISLRGEDGKNYFHEVKKELTLAIERERDDVRITRAEAVPASLSCEKKANLYIIIKNFGTNDQDFAGLTIYNQKLGINENIKDIHLSRNSKSENSYEYASVITPPANLPAGAYPLDVTLVIQKDKTVENKIVPFKIETCEKTNSATTATTNTAANTATNSNSKNTSTTSSSNAAAPPTSSTALPPTSSTAPSSTASPPTASTTTTSNIVKTIEDPYTQDDVVAGLLIVGVTIILAFITWMLVLLLRKEE